MRSNILTKSILGLALTTVASTDALANAPRTGFYVGAALGGAAMTGKSNLMLSRTNPALGVVPSNYAPAIGDKNVAADIFIGFGKKINCWWLGLEVLGNFSSLDSKSLLDITPTVAGNNGQFLTVKTSSAWGGSFNIGYHVNSASALYVKLGFDSRRFRTIFNGALSVTDPNILNINKSTNSTAFMPGLGFATELNPRWCLRGEYRIALHGNKTNQASNSTTQFTIVKNKPTIHFFTLGLAFKI